MYADMEGTPIQGTTFLHINSNVVMIAYHIMSKHSNRTVRFHTNYNPSQCTWRHFLVIIVNNLKRHNSAHQESTTNHRFRCQEKVKLRRENSQFSSFDLLPNLLYLTF